MKRKQQHIADTLAALRIPCRVVDVAAEAPVKDFLRAHSPRLLELPQLWRGTRFLGCHEDFENAVEAQCLPQFLR